MALRPACWIGLILAAGPLCPEAIAQHAQPALMPAHVGRPLDNPLASDEMRCDARLADVCFVDAQTGWAVGDRGAIWHTADGGHTWQLQRSGVACRLESVCFIDPKGGWAAGGSAKPYTHATSGVVLRTTDGGRTWNRDRQLLLPALRRIRFFDDRHGWAVGDTSAMFPTGVFTTDDAGRSWKPTPGGKTPVWRAADFLDPLNGAIAGPAGAVAIVRRGAIQPTRTPGFGLRGLARIELVAPVHGWLIGDGGLLMRTDDLGATWQVPPGSLPEGIGPEFDFHAVAVRGPKVWVSGSPGTRILHTADAGRSWSAMATGQQLPIHGLHFVDDQHGWAVGALGTILATRDGGRSWQRQQSGGTRAAYLAIFSDPKEVPLELLARLSGNEGYLGIVNVLGRRDLTAPEGRAQPADRLHEATVNVGASGAETAWRFPLREEELKLDAQKIIENWDRTNDGRGLDQLEAHLVRQIRLWRPEVVVIPDASPRGDDPLGHMTNQAVLAAVDRAADPTSYIGQLTHAGLRPWSVKKIYASLGDSRSGDTELTTAKVAARLGRSLADAAAEPRGLLCRHFSPGPPALAFRLLANRLPQPSQGRQDFFTGIILQPGGEARRLLREPDAESIELVQQIARKRRNMEAILRRTEDNPQAGAGLVAQSAELTRGLDPSSGGQLLYHLAQRYYQRGQWALAAETFELLASRYADHAMAASARVWLIQYYASGEAAWRVHGHQRRTTVQASTMAADQGQLDERPERAAAIARSVRQIDPGLYHEPALRFPLCRAQRARGYPREAERYYLAARRSPTHDAWWACAQAEQWLVEPTGQAPKPLIFCTQAAAKPRLDGRLDDPLWQRARPVPLRSLGVGNQTPVASVMLAYDSEFLYIAARCPRAESAEYPETPGPRPRDPDLSQRDRIDLLLDIDRDYATYYRLSIDHRGWTGEACWGDRSWNPTWFVAAGSDQADWTTEAAIPLEQLTGHFPKPSVAWAIGIQRIVPGLGLQSATTPASAEIIPEGFGLLIFQ